MLRKILLVAFIACICNSINATDMGNSIDYNLTTQQHSFKKNSSNNKVTIGNNNVKNNYGINNGSTRDTEKI